MWLVLYPSGDAVGEWIGSGLAGANGEPVECLTTGDLGLARHWIHRVDDTRTEIAFTTPGGVRIDSTNVRGVVNRLVFPPPRGWHLRSSDQLYSFQEWSSFCLSWLHGFPCPILNPPDPRGLCGAMLHPMAYWHRAGLVGLPVPPARWSTEPARRQACLPTAYLADEILRLPRFRILVVGGRAMGVDIQAPLPETLKEGCLRFARLARTPLVGFEFAGRTPDRCWLVSTTPCPDLRPAGHEGIEALVEALTDPTFV